jgi:hypothetical protein
MFRIRNGSPNWIKLIITLEKNETVSYYNLQELNSFTILLILLMELKLIKSLKLNLWLTILIILPNKTIGLDDY